MNIRSINYRIRIHISRILIIFFSFFLAFNPTLAASNNQISLDQLVSARTILAEMSVEERVGQLFILGFQGADLSSENPILELITNYHIGGVMLRRDNDNFLAAPDTIAGIHTLVSGLQSAALNKLDSEIAKGTIDKKNPIPLFIGISQNGDSYPYDQILSGMTPMPSQMAIGATWDTEMARKGGEILGRELANLGFNMLFGPSLDVLEIIYIEGGDDLGTRSYGGDPFWVGQMGQSFITGVHQGSEGHVAVIAKNFPGRGSSDRSPESGLATVRKSLDQLKLVELSPFFQVTSQVVGKEESTDGLLISHIRYQGLQGNIRSITRPITFDQGALNLLMGLEPIIDWRASGGILVSDDLGSQAVRNHFSPASQTFDARQVVRNAFQAGSDLLYMNNLVSSEDKDWLTTAKRTIELFVQKYREDQAFADRVNKSAERIISLKLRIFGNFSSDSVIPKDETNQQTFLTDGNYSFEVSQKAVTLISPTPSEIKTVLSQPPEMGERMVFITDELEASQCSTCPINSIFDEESLPKIVLRLYGPNGSGQITTSQVKYYSYANLMAVLENPSRNPELENDLSRAQWLIFSSLNISLDRTNSVALKRFLSERNAQIRDKKVIVFAFNAPYYLDATDISSVTAFYGLFSKNSFFLETAARVLFQEITPSGSSPVSIPGIAYDLNTAMSPDPAQILALGLDKPKLEENKQVDTPEFKIGDVIPLTTGIILDRNGHPVPDGTIARFLFTVTNDRVINEQIEALTVAGNAKTTYRLQQPGVLEIRVSSDPAQESQVLTLDISEGKSGVITSFIPTAMPTAESNIPDPESNQVQNIAIIRPKYFLEWFLGMIGAWMGGFFIFFYTRKYDRNINHLRLSLGAVIGGLSVLAWILLAIPESIKSSGFFGLIGLFLLVFAGNAIGLFTTWHFGNVEKVHNPKE